MTCPVHLKRLVMWGLNMTAYSTPKDLEYYYTRVRDVIDSFDDFGDGSPETAQEFREERESRVKSPFEILRNLTMTMKIAKRKKTNLH